MWLFFVLLVTIITYGVIFSRDGRQSKKYYCAFIFFIFIILAMLRSNEVGNDVRAYTRLYELIADGAQLETLAKRFEWGFLYLCKSLSYLTPDHQILLVVYSAFVFGTIGYFIYRFSLMPWISTVMFFCLFFDDTMAAMRQGMSLAFVLMSFFYINKGKFLPCLLLNTIALLFHNAALVFFVAYPISMIDRYNKKWKFFACLCACAFFILFNPIIEIIIGIFPKYSYYIDTTYFDGKIRIGTFALLSIVGAFYSFGYIVDSKSRASIRQFILSGKSALLEQGYNVISNLGLLSCLLIICSFRRTIIERLSDITSIFLILYYPNMLIKVKNKYLKFFVNLLFMAMIIAYRITVFIYRPEWSSTYPYKFFWSH